MIDSTIKTTTNTNKFFMRGHPGYVSVRSPRREIDVSSDEGGSHEDPPVLAERRHTRSRGGSRMYPERSDEMRSSRNSRERMNSFTNGGIP